VTKKFFWLKLKEDFFNQDEIKVILKKDNGPDYVIIWQKLLLKAITQKDVGILRFNDTIPYTPELLSSVLDYNEDIVKGALAVFMKLEMIEILDNGDIWIKAAAQLVGSETDKAMLMRRLRKQKKIGGGNNVTKALPKRYPEIDIELEKDLKKEKEREKEVKERRVIPSEFDRSIAERFIERAKQYFPSVKRDLSLFADTVRKLRELDGLTEPQIVAITKYLANDPMTDDFHWFYQIGSPAKLRKYDKSKERKIWEWVLNATKKKEKNGLSDFEKNRIAQWRKEDEENEV